MLAHVLVGPHWPVTTGHEVGGTGGGVGVGPLQLFVILKKVNW
jgi:hypothetical protein